MVKSGLTDRVDVSPYRLAAHLGLAAVLLASIIWIVLGCASPGRRLRDSGACARLLLVALVLLQIVIGGFMAGMDAGLVSTSWPDMDGKLVPDGLLEHVPVVAQLVRECTHRAFQPSPRGLPHRCFHRHPLVPTLSQRRFTERDREAEWCWRPSVAVQLLLGIATVISAVPMKLALLHQAGALLLLAAAVFHLHRVDGGSPWTPCRRAAFAE